MKNIATYEVTDTAEEAYKVLRANIEFCQLNKKIKSLALTSYRPGEGKSTTAINLSVCMAKTGMKVLFIDADLRKPMPYKFLSSTNEKGLTNYLMGQVGLDGILNRTNMINFNFITSGMKANNPSELIASEKFTNLLRDMEKIYDIIIIDTPPLGSVIDGAMIAKETDGTIIVIEANVVRCKNALRMKEQLKKANANILGVVLNKIAKSDYKDYYGSYNYYGAKSKDTNTMKWYPRFYRKKTNHG